MDITPTTTPHTPEYPHKPHRTKEKPITKLSGEIPTPIPIPPPHTSTNKEKSSFRRKQSRKQASEN
jgi:hypothetical protein